MSRALTAWARFVAAAPLVVLLVALSLTALAGWRAATALGFKTARLELVGTDMPFVARFQALEREFHDLEAMVVTLEGADPARLKACALALEAQVLADPERFAGAFCRIDPGPLGGRALLWLDPPALARGAVGAERVVPLLLRQGALPGLLSGIAGEMAAMQAEAPADGAAPPGAELLSQRIDALLLQLEQALAGQPPPAAPLGELRFDGDERSWNWAGEGQLLILLVAGRDLPGQLDPQGPAVEQLRRLIAEATKAWPDVTIGLTGKPVLQVDEMATYQSDSLRSSLVSLLLVTGLLVVALRRLLAPLLIGLSLVMAILWTLGLTTLWPGHLNLLATVFVVIVIGLGVDYGIHLVARYDWERAQGHPPEQALPQAFAATGSAIGLAGLTTVLAFAACFLSDFRGLREFGAVAGFGVLSALLVSVSALPALLVLLDRARAGGQPRPPLQPGRPTPLDRVMGRLDALVRGRPALVLLVVAGLTALAIPMARRARWDPNLIALQDPSLPSVQLELRLLGDSRLSSWFLAWPAPDLERLRAAAARVQECPEVLRVESVLDALPPAQEQALPHLLRLQAALRPLAGEGGPLPALEPERLAAGLRALEERCEELGDQALAAGRGEAAARVEAWRERCAAARARVETSGPGRAAALDARLGEVLRDLARRLSEPEAAPVGPADLPPSLRARLIGEQGKLLLRVLPRGNMWDHTQLAAFVEDVQRVLPEATGVPELVLKSSRLMVEGYQTAGVWALAAVGACLLLHFRDLRRVAAALLALGVGAVWTAALLAAAGTTLNPANLVALPLLVGIGIDGAVYVVHQAGAHAGDPERPLLGGNLGRALVYSALTSIAGFGSLMLAHHQGTASIGSSTSVGILACLLAALLVPAALLRLSPPRSPSV